MGKLTVRNKKVGELMKRILFGLLSVVAFHVLVPFNNVAANVWYEEEQLHDVTGDKIKEKLVIKGEINEKKKTAIKNVKFQVQNRTNGKIINLPLENGIKPVMQLADWNHDGVKDVMVTIKSDNENQALTAYMYSFKDNQMLDLEIPPPVDAISSFRNQYKAEIKVQNKRFNIDLSARKKKYDALGFYEKGKLNEPMELIVSPYISLKSTYTLKGYGLKCVQQVSGISESDVIGEITSVWVHISGKWVMQSVSVKSKV